MFVQELRGETICVPRCIFRYASCDDASVSQKRMGIMRHLVPLSFGVCLVSLGSIVWLRGSTTASQAKAASLASPDRPSVAVGCEDRDGDGYGRGCTLGPDCNDQDVRIHPGNGRSAISATMIAMARWMMRLVARHLPRVTGRVS